MLIPTPPEGGLFVTGNPMADSSEHSALIATAIERVNAAQRDIDRVDDDVERVEMSLGDRVGKLETAVTEGFKTLSAEIKNMRTEADERAGAYLMLKRIIGTLLLVLGILATLFAGVFTPPPHH